MEQLIIALAKEVTNNRIALSTIASLYGYDTAVLVHDETITRSWQVVTWVRRIR